MTTQLAPPPEVVAAAAPQSRRRSAHHDALMAGLIAATATTLSTLAVASLLSGTRWLLHALGSIVLVFVLGVAGRAARLPALAVLGAQVLACVGYVTAFYAGPVAGLGFFPGPAATDRLRDRVDAAFTALEGVTPPFTPGHDIALLAVAGVAVTAVAVDALSAGYRRPLLAGVPLLVLYALPASTLPDGPRTWLFALPALGLLLLFVGDDRDRLVRWGLLPDRFDTARTGARRIGTKIGLIVLAISLIIPALVSAGSGAIFEDKGIGRQEDQPIATLDPLVEMRRDLQRPADTDLLQVASDTVRPEEQYLRAVTLDEFNGSQWRAGDREITGFEADLPPTPGLSPTVLSTPVNTTIRGLPTFQTDYLPMPYPATRLEVEGKWRVDPLTGNVLSTAGREQAAGRDYVVAGLDLHPKRTDVGDAEPTDPYLRRYLALPPLPQRITDVARSVTKGRTGALEVGVRLQAWFRNPRNFTYDLSTPQGSGSDAVLNFLNQRRGYCEQFAAAMAVMARTLGIPARVNVGYTAGDAAAAGQAGQAADPGRIISAHDAHAWPELFLPEIGWTRFEPTPGTASSGPTVPEWLKEPEPSKQKDAKGEGEDDSPPSDGQTGGGSAASDGAAPDCSANPDAPGCQAQAAAPLPDVEAESKSHILLWVALVLFLLLALAGAPALARLWQRHRRWASTFRRRDPGWAGTPEAALIMADVAWAELRDTAIDLGYTWPPARTPRQAAELLTREGHLHGRAANSLTDVTALVEQVRYSAAGGRAPDRAYVRGAVEEVCAALGLAAGRDARLFARVAPMSLRTSLSLPTPAKVSARVGHAARRFARRPA